MKRKSSVATLRTGLVAQTIRKSGGTLRSAWNRSRQVCGVSELFGGAGLKPPPRNADAPIENAHSFWE